MTDALIERLKRQCKINLIVSGGFMLSVALLAYAIIFPSGGQAPHPLLGACQLGVLLFAWKQAGNHLHNRTILDHLVKRLQLTQRINTVFNNEDVNK